MANVHLDATEYQDHIVFLHNIQEGPASRSYGLQVAKLAGIPSQVLEAAQQKLTELERGENNPALQPAPVALPPPQSDLFYSAQPHPVVESLENLDIDDLSPRQALQKLYELKARLG
jgi:DNA mismatch repair protein MutS